MMWLFLMLCLVITVIAHWPEKPKQTEWEIKNEKYWGEQRNKFIRYTNKTIE